MKRLASISIVLSSFLIAVSATAKVDVYTKGPVERVTPWEDSFEGSNKGQNSDTNTKAMRSQDSLSGGRFGDGVPVPVTSGVGAIQTFVGDGKQLEGVGFCMSGLKSKANFTLSLIDYGTTSPKNPDALKKGKTVFTEKGSLGKNTDVLQYYFDLSKGGETNLVLPVLLSTNTYGIRLILNDGAAYLFRSTNEDAYAKGVAASYKDDQYYMTRVKDGLRKLNFAIYTASKK